MNEKQLGIGQGNREQKQTFKTGIGPRIKNKKKFRMGIWRRYDMKIIILTEIKTNQDNTNSILTKNHHF